MFGQLLAQPHFPEPISCPDGRLARPEHWLHERLTWLDYFGHCGLSFEQALNSLDFLLLFDRESDFERSFLLFVASFD